jgi:MFS transporter, AAHS family, 4-hydroxybenzoate transporter
MALRPIDVSDFVDEAPVSRFQIVIFAVCGAIAMLDGFDAQMIGYVVPAIAKGWGIVGPAIGANFKWVFTWGLVGLMLGALAGGPAADRFGRKTVMLVSVGVFGLMMLASPFASGIASLSTLRFLTGLGLGGSMPNTIALTAEFAPKRLRTTLISAMFAGFPAGNVVAGLVSVPVIERFGWEGVFVVGGIVPLLLLPVALALLPESVRFLVARNRDVERAGVTLRRIAPEPALGRASLVLREEKLSGAPVAHLFRNGRGPGTLLLWVAFFMNLLIIFFFVSWLPQLLGQVGLSAEHSIWTAALFNGGGTVGGIVVGFLTDRSEPYRLIVACYLVGAAAIAGIALLVFTIFLTGFAIAGAQFALNALAARIYPTQMRSTGVSWGLGIGRIGSIVGPYIAGVLLQLQWVPRDLFLLVTIPALVAALAMLLMSRTELARHA